MKRLHLRFLITGLAVLSVGLFGCSSEESLTTAPTTPEAFQPLDHHGPEPTQSIKEIAETTDGFQTLFAAVGAAGLGDLLDTGGPFTVFAPTNDAFAALPEGLVAQLLLPDNKDKLIEILSYHVVEGTVFSRQLRPWQRVETLLEQTVDIRYRKWTGGSIRVNDSNVVIKDVAATNGVVHAIDAVLIPKGFTLERPTQSIKEIAETTDGFQTLFAAVAAAGLGDLLDTGGPFTVFAPTNDAFAALPEGLVAQLLLPGNKDKLIEILTYHVVDGAITSDMLRPWQRVETKQGDEVKIRYKKWRGGMIRVNDSNVVIKDVLATNGVVHAIDAVLIPKGFTLERPVEPTMNIVETAAANGNFGTLLAAATAAGLAETLANGGPFTVFAPTDDAFNMLPSGTVEKLLANPDMLAKLLLYHVVDGQVASGDLKRFQRVTTKSGQRVWVTKKGDRVRVNTSNVVLADVFATNGVIHAIDKVLVPRGFFRGGDDDSSDSSESSRSGREAR